MKLIKHAFIIGLTTLSIQSNAQKIKYNYDKSRDCNQVFKWI